MHLETVQLYAVSDADSVYLSSFKQSACAVLMRQRGVRPFYRDGSF